MSLGAMTETIAKGDAVPKNYFIGRDIVGVESVLGVEGFESEKGTGDSSSEEGYYYSDGMEGLESDKGTEDSSSEEGYYYSDDATVKAQNFPMDEALILDEVISEYSDESSSDDTTVRDNEEIPVLRIPGSSSDSRDSSPIMLSNDPHAERPVFDSEAMSLGAMTDTIAKGDAVPKNYFIGRDIVGVER